MHFAVLTQEPNNYTSTRLREEGEARGHTVDMIDTLHCYMDIATANPTVRYHGAELPHYDAIIPRIGASITFYGTAVVRQFEMMGTFPVNESVAISRSRDKLRSLQLMSRKGVGMPKTGFAHAPDNTRDLVRKVGGVPVVIKLLEGTQGVGVVLAETWKSAESVIDAFSGLKTNILVQEFIKEAEGSDIRCLVIDGKVVAAMKRTAADGDFRSNLHRGGTSEVVRITKEERATAVKAAKVMGLNVCGVDLLRSSRGPLVMEVNSSPGLQGIEGATGKNLAAAIYEFIEQRARPHATGTRGKG
ncbi:30S ribosomal protein S6--L-glutamate ligase [Natronospirillum operosum]|uniref:Probable alpha-L-glutamate ligase n=1 Tax=Natronospirillum operosum TaxID=2759953 RepID=A0A4Z0WD18_9GAMM|nr:30S ribosomal protein S6--L-glutamate ligase [Natronospirillum operosum]TGG94003.1 30S ribosomal protein S6--L-glutamate ligase [Natronospirillum operosum]